MSVTAIVKNFNSERAFGFLTLEDSADLFFHQSHVAQGYSPQPGDRVAFRRQFDRKSQRMQAIDVRPAPSPVEIIAQMQSLRKQIDGRIPGANEHLTELRFVLSRLHQAAASI